MTPAYFGYPPLFKRNIVYGSERLSNTLTEVRGLHEDQYEETEREWQHVDPQPDYMGFLDLEQNNALVQFTARNDERDIIAYLVYRIGMSYLNTAHTRATEEAFYVRPEDRGVQGGGVGLHLLDYAEDFLAKMGVTMFEHMDKSPLGHANLSRTLERRGYRPVYVSYVKVVEKNDGQQGTQGT